MPQPVVSQVHVARAITQAAIRYTNQLYIAPQVAPVVNVGKDNDKYFIFDKAHWFRDDAQDARAPGTRSPRSGYELSTADYSLKQIAHATPVPDEIVDNADDPLRPFEDASEYSTQMTLIRRERRAATALFVSSTWGTDKTVDDQWSDFTLSDPAADVETGKTAVLQNTGYVPNTLLIGQEVWEKLSQHPDGLDRFKHTQSGVLTEDLVRQWLGIERLIVGRAPYNTAKEGQTASMSFIWGKHALLAYVSPNPSISQPSAAYIFQRNNIETNRFREEAEHQDVVEVTLRTDTVRTATDCGYYFPSVVA